MTPDGYCRGKIATPGSALYYALLFTSRTFRARWVASLALATEIIEILDECSDPAPAHAKLMWWREELERAPVAQRHPTTRALIAADPGIPLGYYQGLLDAVAARVVTPAFTTHAELMAYSDVTDGGLARHAANACVPTDRRTPDHAARLGAAIGLSDHLLHPYRNRGLARLSLAHDDLKRYAIEPSVFGTRTTPPGLRALLRERLSEARIALTDSATAIAPADRPALLPLLILATLRRRMIDTLDRHDYALLERTRGPSPLVKLWTAWRIQHQVRNES